jgi:hypothetical protein
MTYVDREPFWGPSTILHLRKVENCVEMYLTQMRKDEEQAGVRS